MGLEMPETQAHRHFPACRYRGILSVCVYMCVSTCTSHRSTEPPKQPERRWWGQEGWNVRHHGLRLVDG